MAPASNVTNILNPSTQPSAGGHASCTVGYIDVSVQATNTKLELENPASQAILTNVILNIIQPGGNFTTNVVQGPSQVQGTYKILSRFCVPKNANLSSIDTVQFLTHGGSLTSKYWDIAPGYSYVDAAAQAGYATFSYDRLGSGQSERPDPIQVVQGSLEIEIMHAIVQALRAGVFGGHAFKNVIGVGHSLGTSLTIGQTHRYPTDFEALVLTGTSVSTSAIAATLAAPAYIPANTDPRFANLPTGYILQVGPQAIQFLFFKYPYYSQEIFEQFVALKDTATLGEFLTVGSLTLPATNYTGPVDVVDGEADFPFCGGNCYYPNDLTAAVTPALFPAASNGSQSYIVPKVGHNIFAHYDPQLAFKQILNFLKSNGISPS